MRPSATMLRGSAARVSNIVHRVFGLAELRPGQRAVIDAVLAKRHTLAIMPTGAGKSLCYQVPALLMPGMTVIVSPLIALMRDQFDKLSALGLAAAQVNSAISTGEIRRARATIVRRGGRIRVHDTGATGGHRSPSVDVRRCRRPRRHRRSALHQSMGP